MCAAQTHPKLCFSQHFRSGWVPKNDELCPDNKKKKNNSLAVLDLSAHCSKKKPHSSSRNA